MIDFKKVDVQMKIKSTKTISSIFKSIAPSLVSENPTDIELLKAYDFFMDENNTKDELNDRISQMLKNEVEENLRLENYSSKIGKITNVVLYVILFLVIGWLLYSYI